MRNKTVRRRVAARLRDTTSDAEKLRILRSLFIATYNDERSLIPLATELFHLLGDILEGVPAEKLNLQQFQKEKILQTIRDLR